MSRLRRRVSNRRSKLQKTAMPAACFVTVIRIGADPGVAAAMRIGDPG